MFVSERSSSAHDISKCSKFVMIWAICETFAVLWARFAIASLMYCDRIVSSDYGTDGAVSECTHASWILCTLLS